jgi:hypothetical protein
MQIIGVIKKSPADSWYEIPPELLKEFAEEEHVNIDYDTISSFFLYNGFRYFLYIIK